MPNQELLPGVVDDPCPPSVVCDAHDAIRKARRRALARDFGVAVILLGTDWLFMHWPETRLPFASRAHSLTLLRGINALAIADLWLRRALPRWTAMRIASTWSRSERERFLGRARAS